MGGLEEADTCVVAVGSCKLVDAHKLVDLFEKNRFIELNSFDKTTKTNPHNRRPFVAADFVVA